MSAFIAVLPALSGCVSAPIGGAKQNSQTVKVISGKKTAVGSSSLVKQDCTFASYPYNGVVKPPAHGKLDIEHGTTHPRFAKDSMAYLCSNKAVNGNIIYYTSNPGFVGSDQYTLRVTGLNSANPLEDENVSVKVVK